MTAHTAMPRSGQPGRPRREQRAADQYEAGQFEPALYTTEAATTSAEGEGRAVAQYEGGQVAQYEHGQFELEPEQAQEFTIRASQKVHGGLAAGAALVAIGFAASASATPTGILRWMAAAGFALLAVVCARALTVGDLLVADQVGIRLRIRDEWIGTRWEDIEEVTVLRRRHPLDDGRIAVHLLDPGPMLSAMSAATRRTTDANRRLTGSSLAVPFGLTARPSHGEVVQTLHLLADARCPVREQL